MALSEEVVKELQEELAKLSANNHPEAQELKFHYQTEYALLRQEEKINELKEKYEELNLLIGRNSFTKREILIGAVAALMFISGNIDGVIEFLQVEMVTSDE